MPRTSEVRIGMIRIGMMVWMVLLTFQVFIQRTK